ncbi:hypothetical protein EVAR_75284_1 [Eumeta japonica]|uniref:Uncharacterized protein n=1 Tax=Eumeta variegata TaxID=151549 RepID=A0A4C1YY96_EUMVA|nr:hypothetical protein EVAR_75284_1 [Eumeta japonica]
MCYGTLSSSLTTDFIQAQGHDHQPSALMKALRNPSHPPLRRVFRAAPAPVAQAAAADNDRAIEPSGQAFAKNDPNVALLSRNESIFYYWPEYFFSGVAARCVPRVGQGVRARRPRPRPSPAAVIAERCGWESLMKNVTLGNVTMSHRTRERPAECLASLSHSTMIGLPRAQH